MAAHEDLQSYIQSIWDLIQPSARHSSSMTDEQIRGKVEEAKKTIVDLIKDIENPPEERVRIVGICAPDGTPLPLPSTSSSGSNNHHGSTENPTPTKHMDIHEDDALDDSDYDSDNTETKYEPPMQGQVRIVGILAPDGTPLPLPSTSKSATTSGAEGTTEKPKAEKENKVKFYWDDDHAGDFYDDYAEYLKEKETKENLRHLYRILFWLDFISNGFNSNRQHFRHF